MVTTTSIIEEDILFDSLQLIQMENTSMSMYQNKFSRNNRAISSASKIAGTEETIDPLLDVEYPSDTFESLMPMYDSKALAASSNASVLSYSSISSSDTFFGSGSFFETDFLMNEAMHKQHQYQTASSLHQPDPRRSSDVQVRTSSSAGSIYRTSISADTNSSYTLDDEFVGSAVAGNDMFVPQMQSFDDLQMGRGVQYSESYPSLSIMSGSTLDVRPELRQKKNSEHGYSSLESDVEELKYKQVQRQRRYSRKTSTSPQSYSSQNKKVSDSRLSAQGLAEVLKLDSAEEALRRERFILDIFENELHYPLGYKTWVRDTNKEYRSRLLDELHERVRTKYPEYDQNVLETIIRRATYYMMQSRLRRERRAKAKAQRGPSKKNTNSHLDSTISSSRRASNADTKSPAYGPKSFVTGTSFMM